MRPFKVKTDVISNDKSSKNFNKIAASAQRMAAAAMKGSTLAGTAFGRFSQRVETSVKRALVHVNNLNARVNSTFRKMKNSFLSLGIAGIAATALGKKLFDLSNNTAKLGDESAKNSRRIGFSAEALQELQFAADRSGISAEESLKSFEKLSKNIGDLSANTGSLYTILGKTNPQLLKQLKNAQSNEEAFNLITGAIGKLPTDMQKASLAQAAFGRSGQKMLTLIEGGTAGVEALREEARKYGGVISNEAAKASEDFIDAQTNMNFALKGLTNQLGVALMPKIKELSERLTTWIGENKELIKAKVAAFADKIGKTIEFVVKNADKLILAFKMIIGLFVGLKSLTFIMNAITTATWLFNAALAANPITWIVIGIIALIAAIAALIIYWEDIVKWVKTSDNVFAKWIRFALTPLVILFKAIGATISWLSEKFNQLVEWVRTSDSGFAGFIRGSITHLINFFRMIGDIIDWLGEKWDQMTNWISNSDSGFAKFLRSTLTPIINAFKKLGELWDALTGDEKLTLEERGLNPANLTPEQMGLSSKKEVEKTVNANAELTKSLNINSEAINSNTKAQKKEWKGRFTTSILRDQNVSDRVANSAQKDLAVASVSNQVTNSRIQNDILQQKEVTSEVVTPVSGTSRRSNRGGNVNGTITVNVVNRTSGKFGLEIDSEGVNVVTTGNQ